MIKSKEVWTIDDILDEEEDVLEYVFVNKTDGKTQYLNDCEDMFEDLKSQGAKVGEEVEVEVGLPKDEEEASEQAPGLDWEEGAFIILNYKLLRRENEESNNQKG